MYPMCIREAAKKVLPLARPLSRGGVGGGVKARFPINIFGTKCGSFSHKEKKVVKSAFS